MVYECHEYKMQIVNFAVHPNWRRRGIGVQMVSELVSKMTIHRRTHITMELRETNLAAQLFFQQQGFRAVRVLRNFYEDTGEDGYLMEYRLAKEEEVNRIAEYYEEK